MFRLRVIASPGASNPAAPARGTSYPLQDGELSIGRSNDNVVVLPSPRVSKRHCVLVAENGEILLKDQGSSNGTFVNGALTKSRKLRAGDRIAVGDYMLELVEPKAAEVPSLPLAGSPYGNGNGNNVLSFPSPPAGIQVGGVGQGSSIPQAPQDLKGRIAFAFEKYVMPIFYEMNLKTDWKFVCAGILAVYSMAAVVISIYPLMSSSRRMIVQESRKRARFIAKQIAERNAPMMAAKSETKTEIPDSMARADGVRVALLTDLDGRIIAPATRVNQYLAAGSEAAYAIKARDNFFKGRETGMDEMLNSTTVAAIEPVRVLSPVLGKNVTVGMAVVSVDITLATPGYGELGVIYSHAFIMVSILGVLVLVVLYRLTLKPFEALNEDMDRVLKGDMQSVTRKYRWDEMDSLFDLINSALQRAVRSMGGGVGMEETTREITSDEYLASIQAMSEALKSGVVVCGADRRVIYMNPAFEEISGINSSRAMGQELSEAAMDRGFSQLVADAMNQAQPGGQAVEEQCEFGGIYYSMFVSAFGAVGSTPRCFLFSFVRKEI